MYGPDEPFPHNPPRYYADRTSAPPQSLEDEERDEAEAAAHFEALRRLEEERWPETSIGRAIGDGLASIFGRPPHRASQA